MILLQLKHCVNLLVVEAVYTKKFRISPIKHSRGIVFYEREGVCVGGGEGRGRRLEPKV